MIRPYQSIERTAAMTANSAAAAAKSAVISVCRCSKTSFELSVSYTFLRSPAVPA